ncbi:hypothetical protein VE04_07440 [Pseudogymnoascus sp. 24MN13]|nr:hypothetical protein VE04_07440 [Pseudogymnoascus sp. 24MN13]
MSSVSNHYSRGSAVFIVTTVTFVLATIFVAARLISRFGILRRRTADDWCMIFAWLLAFGHSFSIGFGTFRGLGRHDVDIPDSWLQSLRQAEYAFTILYYPALTATKTSILIFYLRITRQTHKIFRIASYITLGVVNVAGFVLACLNAFQCNPVSSAYASTSSGKCMSIVTVYLCSAPVNIITDVAILVLPIPILTGDRLPRRQKTILIFTFTLAVFVIAVDIVRIYYLQLAATTQTLTHSRIGTDPDFSYNASTALMWSAVEVNVGVICACIPTLKPLVQRILPSMLRDRPGWSTVYDSQVAPNFSNGPAHRLSSISAPATSIRSLPPHRQGENPGIEHDEIGRSQTNRTHTTEESVYFDFIDLRPPMSMLKTKGKDSFKYCTMVTILFSLWGFSEGLLNTVNTEISVIANQSTGQTLSLTAAYFSCGYFFGPLTVGQWVLRHGGFKSTFICGLCIYGTGTLMFWPSAVLMSFPGFIICSFVVGFGLSVLETAANPFLALCGPSKHAEFRLLLAQAIQAVASVLSKLLAQRVLLPSVGRDSSLINVQWIYLAVTFLTVILALLFYYLPLPEASDTDLQLQSDGLGICPSTPSILSPRLPLIYLTLALAVFAQFLYVAAQECMATWFSILLTTLSTPHTFTPLTLSVDNYALVSLTTFAIARFIFCPLCLIFRPRILLLITFCGGIVVSALTTALHVNVNALAAPALMFFFFEGPAWPLIFAIGLRGMGRRTKLAAAFLTASASGGGLFPFAMWGVQHVSHKTVQYSFCVIVALFAFGTIFPLYLNIVPGARHQVDPANLWSLAVDEPQRRGHQPADEGPDSPFGRMSIRFTTFMNRAGGNGAGDERKIPSSLGPIVEHIEVEGRSEVKVGPARWFRAGFPWF